MNDYQTTITHGFNGSARNNKGRKDSSNIKFFRPCWWVSLGLFDYLAKEGASDRKVIAENIGINGAFSRFFLDSMVENGLLNRDGESYSNNDIANTFLVSTSPLYRGNWIKENGHGD